MNPATIISSAMADGVNLALCATGTIRATGNAVAVNRWLPIIREHKPGILAALQQAANAPDVFWFSPLGDPANGDEALQERAANMMKSNHWDEATALREARWIVDREKTWRAFQRNAQIVLAAPAHQRDRLLEVYQAEAAKRYGRAAGAAMLAGLRSWVQASAALASAVSSDNRASKSKMA